jgi:hypothetical protein
MEGGRPPARKGIRGMTWEGEGSATEDGPPAMDALPGRGWRQHRTYAASGRDRATVGHGGC